MKKSVLLSSAFLLMGLLFGSQAMAQGRIELGRAKSAQECANVSKDGFTAIFSFRDIEATEVSTSKGVFSEIAMDGAYPTGNVGEPSLPAAHQLIALPYGATNVTLEVKGYSTTTYRLADFGIKTIAPQQASVRKDQKPESVKFAYDEKAYASRTMSQRPVASLKVNGNLRGITVGSLVVNPVNYNPATNSIEVYNDIEVEVRYNDYDKAVAENEFLRTYNHYFKGIYQAMFNWRDDVYDQHPDLWQAPVRMLVIADRMFEEVMQPWIEWKTTKGFYMDVNYTDNIGSNAAAIRSFIQDKYNTEPPTFVIIFGDKEQVPASATGSETQCVTDLQYMSVDNDDYPDIYHSRMCAQTVEQMQNIIYKTLLYEQYTELNDPKYLNDVLLIAGWDYNWTNTVGKPTIQYAMEYYYNEEHGFENVHNFLGQPYNNPYASLHTGVSFVNYTAHGGEDCWADPEFNITDVNNLTNEGKPFLAMGNCCVAANWGWSSTCFGEAMIRNNNKAAYAYIGSCPNTYWYEDYYFGVGATSVLNRMPTYEETAYGVYDAIWDDDVFNTVSAIPFLGNIAVCYAHAGGYSGSVTDKYYWQAYHALGDGSVMPFRVNPTNNVVSHMPTMPIGMPTYEVSANPGSYVAVSKDGVLHGAGLVGQSGVITLDIDPITSGGDVTICVTHPQHIPYIQVVPAASLDGAYVSVGGFTPAETHVGDETPMSITFKNVGTQPTGNTTTVNLSCDAHDLSIINGTASFDNLAPEATVEIGGFSYRIAEGVADGTKFTIQVTATCGNEVWEGKVVVTACEAVLQYSEMVYAGGFVPGETLSVMAVFANTGHYMATNAVATVASTSQYVSFENTTYEVGTIAPNGTGVCVFNVSIASNCPETEQLPLTFSLNADGGLVAEGSASIMNACNVVFNLHDSYGDGWNGNALKVSFSDGTPSQELTINSGAEASYTIEIGNGVQVTMNWISGQWTSECSFDVKYEDGTLIYQESNPNSSLNYQFTCNCGGAGSGETFEPIQNLGFTIDGQQVVLTWQAPRDAASYTIARNGLEIANVTEFTFTDELDKEGTYTYCVVAEYANGVSLPECVIVRTEWGIEEGEDLFAVYPNPTSNALNITCGTAEYSYEMFNGMGQVVANGIANGTAQISVDGMAKGIYFLRLTTGTKVRVEKVVVE